MRKKALALLLTFAMLGGTLAGLAPGQVALAQSDGEDAEPVITASEPTAPGGNTAGTNSTVTNSNDNDNANANNANSTVNDNEGNTNNANNEDTNTNNDNTNNDNTNNDNTNNDNTNNDNTNNTNNDNTNNNNADNNDESNEDDEDDEDNNDEDDEDDFDSMTEEEKEAFRKQRDEATTLEDDDLLKLTDYSIEWVRASSNSEISDDKHSLTMTPNNNQQQSTYAVCRVSFNTSGNKEGVPIHQAEIRIPKNIFFYRDGTASTKPTPSVVLSPATGGNTFFHYYFDDKGDADPATDEIVITNYAALPEGSVHFECEITWKYGPTLIANGYHKDNIGATFSFVGSSGTTINQSINDAQKMDVTVYTAPKINYPVKNKLEKYENWKAEWGEQPADSNQYFYVVWRVNCMMFHFQSTSPYKVFFEDDPGSNIPDADVVAWSNTYYGSGPASSYTAGDSEAMKDDLVIENATLYEINNYRNISRDVVVRYPREYVLDANGKPYKRKIYNTYTARVVRPEGEGDDLTRTASSYYIYEPVSGDVQYPGDKIASYKRAKAGVTLNGSAQKVDAKSYQAAINLLKNEIPVTGSWSIDTTQYAFNKTNELQNTYKTVLRDGLLYIGGERLEPTDYELVKFYPDLYEVKVKKYSDDLGYYLTDSTEYANDYAPINVFYRTSQNDNWVLFGAVGRATNGDFTWTPKDGSAVPCSASAPVSLPPGTVDVKFEHEDAKYAVNYRMNLFHKLNHTEHVMTLIGEDTAQIDLVNISDSYGEQAGKIFTPGTFPNDEFTVGIRTDVEASDQENYENMLQGTENAGIAHGMSRHVLAQTEGEGEFTKRYFPGEFNDTGNSRVRIPVELKWKYGFEFTPLGITLQEAFNSQIIKEARQAVFYDLLPSGCTVDLASIKVSPCAVTNYLGQTLAQCDYSLEMVNNWRDSGQTMMILRVTVPEGFTNYAKKKVSTTESLETGFLVTFNMYDSWENIMVSGTTLINNAAIVCQEGSVPGGAPDNGTGSLQPNLFKDLYTPTGGSHENNPRNVRYANATKELSVMMSQQTGFDKKVKSATGGGFTDTAIVPATGQYSYNLRYSVENGSSISNLVMFDILETAYIRDNSPDANHWQGSFQGINVGSIQKALPDCDIKVYYSTNTDVTGIKEESLPAGWTDLTNATRWSNTPPTDLSSVTAVAIDLRKDKDDSVLEIPGPKTVMAEIFMKAPADYEQYVTPIIYAYNKGFTEYTSNGAVLKSPSDTTTVRLKKPDVTIGKTAVPKTGTQTEPCEVQAGDQIKYSLAVSNKDIGAAISDVSVTDKLPADLRVKGNLQFYFDSNPSEIKDVGPAESVRATVTQDSTGAQTVTFSVDNLSGNQTVHLVITAEVQPSANKGVRIENQATIQAFNGRNNWNITSQKTYHKTSLVTTNVAVRKDWNDNNNFYGGRKPVRVQLYQDGTLMPSNSVTLNAPLWTETFSGLPKYKDNGVDLHEYTVKEETELKGYIVAYTKEADGTCVITNTIRAVNVNQADLFDIKKLRAGTEILVPGVTFKAYVQGADPATATPLATVTTGMNGIATFNIPIPDDLTGTDFALDLYETALPNGYTALATMQTPSTSANPIKLTLKKSSTPTPVYDPAIANYKDVYLWTVGSTSVVVPALPGGTPGGTSGGSWDATSKTLTVKNPYAAEPVSLKIPVKKVIEGNERPTGGEKRFTFTLTKGDTVPAGGVVPMPEGTATGVNTATIDITDEGVAGFNAITFTEPGTYTYTITENALLTTGYTGYNGSTESHTVVVTVIDDDATLKATYTVDGEVYPAAEFEGKTVPVAQFTNRYEPTPVNVTFRARKKIEGDPIPSGENKKTFSFIIKGISGTPTPDNNQISIIFDNTGKEKSQAFSALSFTKAGTYRYAIAEIGGSAPGYTYDTSEHLIKVVVTDVDGTLQATVSYTNDNPLETVTVGTEEQKQVSFTNTYKPSPVMLSIPVKKTITGTERPEESKKNFSFELKNINMPTGVTNAPMPAGTAAGETTATVIINDEGVTPFKDIKFEKAGEYKYEIKEIVPATAVDFKGYSFDHGTHTITVSVTDTQGVLSATWSSSVTNDNNTAGQGYQVGFTNHYEPLTTSQLAIPVQKTVAPDSNNTPFLSGYTANFEFTLSATGSAPLPVNLAERKVHASISQVDTTSTPQTFGAVQFTKAGTYYYQITENKTYTSNQAFAYDVSTHVVEVHVTDDDGQLEYSVKIDGTTVNDISASPVHFTNTFAPPADKVSFIVHKDITGHERVDDYKKEFVFQLVAVTSDAPMPQYAKTSVIDTDDGFIGEIAFDRVGDFEYQIIEEKTGTEHTGYTYDDNVCTVKVHSQIVATSGGDTAFQATVIYSNNKHTGVIDKALFENTYTPNPASYRLPVYKKITGDERPGSQLFTFNIERVSTDAPLPTSMTTTVYGPAGNEEKEGKFGAITFSKSGTYTYKVTEVDSHKPGYTYDTSSYKAEIKVEDRDGTLQVTEVKYTKIDGTTTAHADKALFENEYHPKPLTWQLPVNKEITGVARKPAYYKDFTFKLSAVDGAPAPAGSGDTATIKDAGSGTFGEVTFAKAGSYTYKVWEENGSAQGYTYDTARRFVTVEVTDIGAKLAVNSIKTKVGIVSDDGEPVFTNHYAPSGENYPLPIVQKIINGPGKGNGTFSHSHYQIYRYETKRQVFIRFSKKLKTS